MSELPTRRNWWHVDRTTWLMRAVLVVAVGMLIRGVMLGVTGDERAGLPPLVERVDPVPEAVQVLSQTSITADLASGYTGVFIIDGVEVPTVNADELRSESSGPGAQVSLPGATIYEPGNSVLTFTPSDSAPIAEFTEGDHRVELVYWEVSESRQRARTYVWTFSVI